MGAETFFTEASGRTPEEAFEKAVKDARYWYGHSGYTGTIGEKDSFTLILLPDGMDPIAYANKLFNENDERIDDKWGPAGCILFQSSNPSGENTYLFFGWASS